jgi:hypothetical protein
VKELALVDFCVFSQRLGSSRRFAFRAWARYQEGASFEVFARAWRAARAAERLAQEYPGLRRPL